VAISLGLLEVDESRGCAVVDGRVVMLRPLDFRVLALLARNPGRVVDRDTLAESLWGPGTSVDRRAIDSSVVRLRRALDDVGRAIITIRRVGYRLDPDVLMVDQT
jgi:DNA-binding response OmpR family regulator